MKSLSVSQACEVLKSGGVVAYPTETFYGLAVDPQNTTAIDRLFKVKQRDRGKPVSILVGRRADVLEWASEVPEAARYLMDEFWPGPLTLVFKSRPTTNPLLTAGTGNIGIRISPHPLAAAMAQKLGAITTTSANISGLEPILEPRHLKSMLGLSIDGFVDGGNLPSSKGSTILDISQQPIKLIRAGEVFIDIEKLSF